MVVLLVVDIDLEWVVVLTSVGCVKTLEVLSPGRQVMSLATKNMSQMANLKMVVARLRMIETALNFVGAPIDEYAVVDGEAVSS